MLLLKLTLVPAFLLALSLITKYYGPSVSGWLAGLPVVAGPILFVLALQNGAAFASIAASSSMAAVFASVTFSVFYSHASQRYGWQRSLPISLIAWFCAAYLLTLLPTAPIYSLTVAISTLILAPRLFPSAMTHPVSGKIRGLELVLRMLAGAILTVVVALLSPAVGTTWSGLLAVFPVLGVVLAVSSHRSNGSAFATALLRAMATGLYSFTAFCFVLTLALPSMSAPLAFLLAAGSSIAVQAASRRRITPRST